jgi:hypothetical protein
MKIHKFFLIFFQHLIIFEIALKIIILLLKPLLLDMKDIKNDTPLQKLKDKLILIFLLAYTL